MSAKPISLSQLLGAVEQTFEEIFSGHVFTVLAETGDIKNYPDRQYCFFTLIEKQNGETVAKADAVIWRSHYPTISAFETTTGRRFEKNMQLLVKVEVTYHSVYGLRLRVIEIDTHYTLGQIEQERRQVLENLVKKHPELISLRDGEYYTANKKTALPEVIKNIALITAPNSDGLRDFMHELENNPYGYHFHVTPFLTRIQGKGAELDISAALEKVKKKAGQFDVLVMVRGGGSGLDLGPFDTFEPGLQIAGFPIPAITGIGHERNISVCDLMSHTKVKTPTKAASFIIEHNAAFEEAVLGLGEHILNQAERQVQKMQLHLMKHTGSLFPAASAVLMQAFHKLDRIEQAAKANDPQRILARGYALVRKNGKTVFKNQELKPGDSVSIQLSEGQAGAQITTLS